MVLRDEGYQVVPADDGQVALDILNAGLKPTVVLVDLMMPRVNGFEFLERAHELLGFARIPVIVVSANQGYEAWRARRVRGRSEAVERRDAHRSCRARCSVESRTLERGARQRVTGQEEAAIGSVK
ncbi:MAG: response regulator [Actinobacteria bacterium]|nr:response regulator [Actinomycetota bacterium]